MHQLNVDSLVMQFFCSCTAVLILGRVLYFIYIYICTHPHTNICIHFKEISVILRQLCTVSAKNG